MSVLGKRSALVGSTHVVWRLLARSAFRSRMICLRASLVMASFAQGAYGQDAPPATAPSAAQAEPPISNQQQASNEQKERERAAANLFWQANDAFSLGNFAQAIELYTRAHELSREPALLFNLAEAHKRFGDCQAAELAYERYRALEPNPPAAAREWSAAGAECRTNATSAPEPSAASAPPPALIAPAVVAPDSGVAAPAVPAAHDAVVNPTLSGAATSASRLPARDDGAPRSWTSREIVAWSLIGGGVAAVVGCGWAALEANDAQDDAHRAAQRLIGSDTPWDSAGENFERDAESKRSLALGLGIGGAVLIVSGVVLRLTGEPESRTAAAADGFLAKVSEQGAAVGWRGRF